MLVIVQPEDFWHYWSKGTQFGASTVEMRTRQAAFLAYVDILHENGLTAKDGLYRLHVTSAVACRWKQLC